MYAPSKNPAKTTTFNVSFFYIFYAFRAKTGALGVLVDVAVSEAPISTRSLSKFSCKSMFPSANFLITFFAFDPIFATSKISRILSFLMPSGATEKFSSSKIISHSSISRFVRKQVLVRTLGSSHDSKTVEIRLIPFSSKNLAMDFRLKREVEEIAETWNLGTYLLMQRLEIPTIGPRRKFPANQRAH